MPFSIVLDAGCDLGQLKDVKRSILHAFTNHRLRRQAPSAFWVPMTYYAWQVRRMKDQTMTGEPSFLSRPTRLSNVEEGRRNGSYIPNPK